MAPGLVAAAAIVVVAGLVVPGLVHKSPASTGANNVALPAQHGPGPLSGQSPAVAPSFGRAGGTAAKTKEHAASGPSGLEGVRATGQRAPVLSFCHGPAGRSRRKPTKRPSDRGHLGRGHRHRPRWGHRSAFRQRGCGTGRRGVRRRDQGAFAGARTGDGGYRRERPDQEKSRFAGRPLHVHPVAPTEAGLWLQPGRPVPVINTMHDPSIPETGWYPDPADPETSLRLWDGESWTDKTSPRPRQSTGAVPGPALGQGATVPAATATMASLEGQQQTPPSQQGVSPQGPSSNPAPSDLGATPDASQWPPRLLRPRKVMGRRPHTEHPSTAHPSTAHPCTGHPLTAHPRTRTSGRPITPLRRLPRASLREFWLPSASASACSSWWRSWRPSRSRHS